MRIGAQGAKQSAGLHVIFGFDQREKENFAGRGTNKAADSDEERRPSMLLMRN